MNVTRSVDALIHAKWVVPVAPVDAVLADHAVAIEDGRIVALLPSAEARARYVAAQVVELPDHALIPGLVNAHTHAAMALMRGMADDLPLMRWLREHIWPAESRHVSRDFVYDGTLLAAAEMLRGGVTCANDMYFYPESAARAFVDAGMRAAMGIIAIEVATQYASGPDDYIAKGLAARDQFAGEPRLSFCLAPHAPYTVSDRTFGKLATIAEELDLPIHCHLHETLEEIEQSTNEHRARPLDRLAAIGVVSPRLIAVHAVHLSAREIEQLAAHGASVAHCASSNLKLASGFAPIAALMAQGVNVALGTDGAASNNRLDLFQEMRTAALLAKAVSANPEAMPAHAVLRAATLGGAKALGLNDRIGSIEAGKWADLCAVSFADPMVNPCFDPVSHLVYVCGREQVTHVWVGGESKVMEGRPVSPLLTGLEKRIFLWHNRLLA
jgi:5-methylthioadenosine/S-adenosylhomocysteine deaminase